MGTQKLGKSVFGNVPISKPADKKPEEPPKPPQATTTLPQPSTNLLQPSTLPKTSTNLQ
jgi:hypothetical protein